MILDRETSGVPTRDEDKMIEGVYVSNWGVLYGDHQPKKKTTKKEKRNV